VRRRSGSPPGGFELDDAGAAPVLRAITLPSFATPIVVSLAPSRTLDFVRPRPGYQSTW